MEEHKLFHDRYFLERLLGRGNFSEVWLAKDTKTDIEVALKIYAPATGLDDAGLDVFAREFSLVVNANHKNLLKPLYYDSCDRKPYLVLPFCRQGSIMKAVGKFSEEDVWRLLRDVSSGLAWLHGMNPPVIHQDIKPDNIMIGDNGDFMITDFGVSTHLKSTLRKSLSSAFSSAGTIAYMAPERFSKDNTPIMANDIYSLGATAFEMLAGDTPFGNDGGLVQKKGAEVPELQGDYSKQLKKVIAKCLKTNPWERPTAEQLEKYAETGLQGGEIDFVDEHVKFKKYKKLIYASVGVVLVAAIVVCSLMVRKSHNERVEAELRQEIMMHNDSINMKVSKLIEAGDRLYAEGEVHDEGYENSYIKAYNFYMQAVQCENELRGGETLGNKEEIEIKADELGGKLYESYKSFMDKAEFFKNEAAVSGEFRERAAAIRNTINIEKYEQDAVQQTPIGSDGSEE